MAKPTKRRSCATSTGKEPLPAPVEGLFARHPALAGFAVRGVADVPDNCARSGWDGELFISDIGLSPDLSSEQSGEIYEEIATALSEYIAEQPDAGALLRGRTFARVLH
jgi:hypothetical protein